MTKEKKDPTKEDLERLYHEDGLTAKEIGEIYSIHKKGILQRMRKHGIPRRLPGVGLEAKGRTPPDKSTLYHLVHIDKLTYEQIAPRFGWDPSAIGYWLDKYGIDRPGPHSAYPQQREAVEKLPRHILSDLYQGKGLSLEQIGAMYDLTEYRVTWLCKKYGIKRRPPGWTTEEFLCDDGHTVKSSYELRVDNWLSGKQISHTYEPTLPFNRRMKADFFANGWYIEVWGVIDSKKYQKRKKKKIQLYLSCNIPLIEIPVHAFDAHRNNQWERLLAKCLQATANFAMLQL